VDSTDKDGYQRAGVCPAEITHGAARAGPGHTGNSAATRRSVANRVDAPADARSKRIEQARSAAHKHGRKCGATRSNSGCNANGPATIFEPMAGWFKVISNERLVPRERHGLRDILQDYASSFGTKRTATLLADAQSSWMPHRDS